MPRTARKRSQSGVYHVMEKGIDGQRIFLDNEDRKRYLQTLQRITSEGACDVHAYCLMDNHVHLLLSEGSEEISLVMKRIGISYAHWFNTKYGRLGYVFQGRYASEPVEDDTYFMTVLRYILQNPVKAGICDGVEGYQWSSYHAYQTLRKTQAIVSTDFAVNLFESSSELLRFVRTPGDTECLDVSEKHKASDQEVCLVLNRLLAGSPCRALRDMPLHERKRIIRILKAIEGATIRQIARLTGLDRGVVDRA